MVISTGKTFKIARNCLIVRVPPGNEIVSLLTIVSEDVSTFLSHLGSSFIRQDHNYAYHLQFVSIHHLQSFQHIMGIKYFLLYKSSLQYVVKL